MLKRVLEKLLGWHWRSKGVSASYGVRLRNMKRSEWQEPFAKRTYTAIDCEMTGLDSSRDEILSIGAVRIRNGRVILGERYYRVFKPARAVSTTEVILIHGLGHEEVAQGVPFAEALDELQSFLGDSILVTHFGSIDLEFLNAALHRNSRRSLTNPVLDTAKVASWYMEKTAFSASQKEPRLRLEDLVEDFDLPKYPSHHAYYDALTTAQLFLKLCSHVEALGVVQLGALFRLGGIS